MFDKHYGILLSTCLKYQKFKGKQLSKGLYDILLGMTNDFQNHWSIIKVTISSMLVQGCKTPKS